jgi:hypothetical protein
MNVQPQEAGEEVKAIRHRLGRFSLFELYAVCFKSCGDLGI